MQTVTVDSEDDNHREVHLSGETKTFAVQIGKIPQLKSFRS